MLDTSLSPQLIMDQMQTLGDLHRDSFNEIDRSVRQAFTALEMESVKKIYTVGDGDSYHASLGCEMAFNEFAKIVNFPMPAMRFLEYGADYIRVNFPNDTIVMGISASGGSSRVVQSLERTRQATTGVQVAALVGNMESRVAQSADKVISAQIPELGRSPGIRTYTASLMGLLALAIRIGEQKRHYHMNTANEYRQEIVAMADAVEATIAAAKGVAQTAARACANAPFISYAGSGPGFGSAIFSSAKVVEACGIFSVAQDLEEWAHVERFSYPLEFPVFLVAPPGKGYWRALELAKAIKAMGHPLMSVIDKDDTEIKELSDYVFPVQAKVREAFAPLLYYQAGTLFSYYLAQETGRCMFMTDNEKVMKIREELRKQIQG